MKNLFYTLLLCLGVASPYTQAQTAPDFSFTDVNGDTHTLSEALADGKVILLDFFFVDCGPCQQTAPWIDQLVADYENTNFEVWAVSDRDSDSYISSSMFDPTHGNHKVGGSQGGGAAVVNLYAANFDFTGFPTYSLICSDGSITWDIWPLSNGMPEIRDMLTEECGVMTNSTPVREVGGLSDLSAYPNPAISQAQLQFELQESKWLSIQVVNLLGQSVTVVPEKEYKAGRNELTFAVENWPAGLYFIQIQSKEGVTTLEFKVSG